MKLHKGNGVVVIIKNVPIHFLLEAIKVQLSLRHSQACEDTKSHIPILYLIAVILKLLQKK